MADGAKTSGIALGGILAGVTLVYAGLTGKDILGLVKSVVQGKSPATVGQKFGITGTSFTDGSSSSGSAGDVAAGASEQSYFSAVLRDLGAPVTDANLQAFYRWAVKEEPTFPPDTSWQWNPLNIGGPGGFKSWPSPQAGAMGTAGFLLANNYGAIVSSLRTGQGIQDSPAVASELSAWSGGGYTSVNSGGG